MARFAITYEFTVEHRYHSTQNTTHLVDIHVTLSTTSCLEDHEREVVDQLAGDNLRAQRSVARPHTRTAAEPTSSAACWMAWPTLGSSPYPTLTTDAAFLSTPNALISGGGKRSVGPPMSKFCRDLHAGRGCVSRGGPVAGQLEVCVPLRLRSPVAIRGDLELAEGVALDAELLFRLPYAARWRSVRAGRAGRRACIP